MKTVLRGIRTGRTDYTRWPHTAFAVALLAGAILAAARPAAALDRLCDPSFENCRPQLLDLINKETQGIDVAFWFMEDPRYLSAIVAKWQAGVPVRVLVDPRASATYPLNAGILQGLVDAGVPMRMRIASGILHWKLIVFAGQGVVEFSGANYSENAFKPVIPYANYVDESIFFTDDPAIVNTFKTKFDTSWIDGASFANYANITAPLTRRYPVFSQAAELNFPPGQSYATRAVALYTAEPSGIDVIMYRVTDRRHSDAMIAAKARGVPVRIITDLKEYRLVAKLWHAWNIDRMWAAGIPMRVPAHAGMNHQKSVILKGQRTVIFGSSNWTSPSDRSQQEHNFFSHASAWIFDWFSDQFDRKWNNANPSSIAETKPFVPLPPDAPKAVSPKTLATGVATSVKLTWYGGPWAHTYDVYFGTSPTPPRVATNKNLGPSLTTGQYQSFTVSSLAAHTTYYWKIVSKTAAGKTKSGAVWSFTTGS
jgi:phosphatidylserine/phosphatidylglycerophosphate/cardiolipin synthase-like enzyme